MDNLAQMFAPLEQQQQQNPQEQLGQILQRVAAERMMQTFTQGDPRFWPPELRMRYSGVGDRNTFPFASNGYRTGGGY